MTLLRWPPLMGLCLVLSLAPLSRAQIISVKPSTSSSPAAAPASGPKKLTAEEQAFLDRDITVHVLNRCAFGPKPGQIMKVYEKGWKKWLEEQLTPEKIDDSALEKKLLDKYPSLAMDLKATWTTYQPGYEAMAQNMGMMMGEDGKMSEAQRRELQRKQNELRGKIRREIMDSVVVRAAESERQLVEVLAEFWRNHLCIEINKDEIVYLAPNYEQTVIRQHMFGKFEDMLLASASHPAMLIYLDNVISQRPLTDQELLRIERWNPSQGRKPRSVAALERHRGLNENYARELLELHTLGADNYYNQFDVYELARVLTGWSIDYNKRGDYGFFFRQDYHDKLPKRILGVQISGNGGLNDGVTVIRSLARHRGTADFVSWKLCRYFLNDEPPVEMVQRVARKWRATGGDLRAVYREILFSPEFADPIHFRAKFKTPFEYVVSAIRATDAKIDDLRPLHDHLARMGQPIYQCDDPTGYFDQAEAWCDPGVMVHRWDFGMRLAHNQFPGLSVPDSFFNTIGKGDADEVKRRIISNVIARDLDPRVNEFLDNEVARTSGGKQGAQWLLALIMGSPAFQQQ